MISVVLPAFNEAPVLESLFERLEAAAKHWDDEYEVIVVDDGSTDLTPQIVEEFHRRNPSWKLLRFSRNFGHQCAVAAGIQYASGDAIAIIDADLQDPPEELVRFIDKWRSGYQVVYAIRTKRKENILKRTAYAAFYRMLRSIASIDIPLDSGDFCVIDRSVADVMRAMPERTRFVRGLRSWSGFQQVGVSYERQARAAGEVKYTFKKLFKLATDGLLSFSSKPLRIASTIGVACCFISILFIGMVVAWWASDVHLFGMHPKNSVGWTSLVSMILFLSGMQMLFIGIVGEYLARVFEEVKSRPPWVISQAVGIWPNEDQEPVGWFASKRTFSIIGQPVLQMTEPFARAC